jgi:hypothetical protein
MINELPISPKKNFKYSITFQSWDEESLEIGETDDKGYEVEETTDTIGEILYEANTTYGIYMPVSFGYWESTEPEENRDFFEKGIRKYYALHITNEDGTDISQEESDFISFLLSDGRYEIDKFREYAVGGIVLGSIALGVGALITYFYLRGKNGSKGKKIINKTSKSVTYNINGKERKFPIKDAWKREHSLENKSEEYEVPQADRFEMGGDASEHYHEIEYGEGGVARAKTNKKTKVKNMKPSQRKLAEGGSIETIGISKEEYYLVVQNWVYFTFNYPINFVKDAFNSNHLEEKFSSSYSKYGSIAVLMSFWMQLDNENRETLTIWIKNNYFNGDKERLLSVSDSNYSAIIKHWNLFCFNYPYDFVEKAFNNDHYEVKFTRSYESAGSVGAVNRFFTELSSNNQETLTNWVYDNYKEIIYADGGRVTTNEEIIEEFLTSNKELKVGNLSTHFNEHDSEVLLRNYGTLIALRKGNDVSITNIKYSKTTTTITNKVRMMALKKRMNVKHNDKFAEGGEAGGKTQDNYNALIGRIGDEFYFLDYIFKHNDGFKGATGTIVMPVSKEYYEYATSEEGILERYMDAMGEDEWISTLGLDRDNFEDENDLTKAIEDGIWQLYNAGELNPFDEVDSNIEEQMRALPQFASSEEYPVFEVIGGGRSFDKERVFDEIYNQELFDKIKEAEEFAEGGETGKKSQKSKIKKKDPKMVRQYFEDKAYAYAEGGEAGNGMSELHSDLIGESISHATLKTEHLISVFMDFLNSKKSELNSEIGNRINKIQSEIDTLEVDEFGDYVGESEEKADYILNEDIFDLMNDIAPDGTYFGSTEGDGSDFGFWLIEDEDSEGDSDDEEFAEGGEVQEWMDEALESLIEETGYDDLEITMVSDNGNEFYATDGITEYRVFRTEDDAQEKAIEQVREDMEESPENFNKEFIMNYIDGGKFFESALNEMNLSYAEDIQSEDDKRYANRLIAEMVENGIMDEEDALSDNAEELADYYMEDFVNLMTENQLDEGNDGLDYFISNFGEEETYKMVRDNNLIDIDEASRDAVNYDGIAHFLTYFDGETLYLSNDYVAYRVN